MELTIMNVYGLCNRHQWFTCGTNRQYEKMFDYVRENNIKATDTEKLKKVATMIWLCSDDNFTEEEIYEELKKVFAD